MLSLFVSAPKKGLGSTLQISNEITFTALQKMHFQHVRLWIR